jgi:hypothetical protein
MKNELPFEMNFLTADAPTKSNFSCRLFSSGRYSLNLKKQLLIVNGILGT